MFAEPARASGAAADQAFQVWHKPPGLLLRGEPASLSVTVEPTGVHPRGEGYVRGENRAGFTRVPMVWDDRRGRLVAQVPAKLLAGSLLDEYVVVRDPASGRSLTDPAAGPRAPYRRWIVDHPAT